MKFLTEISAFFEKQIDGNHHHSPDSDLKNKREEKLAPEVKLRQQIASGNKKGDTNGVLWHQNEVSDHNFNRFWNKMIQKQFIVTLDGFEN